MAQPTKPRPQLRPARSYLVGETLLALLTGRPEGGLAHDDFHANGQAKGHRPANPALALSAQLQLGAVRATHLLHEARVPQVRPAPAACPHGVLLLLHLVAMRTMWCDVSFTFARAPITSAALLCCAAPQRLALSRHARCNGWQWYLRCSPQRRLSHDPRPWCVAHRRIASLMARVRGACAAHRCVAPLMTRARGACVVHRCFAPLPARSPWRTRCWRCAATISTNGPQSRRPPQ